MLALPGCGDRWADEVEAGRAAVPGRVRVRPHLDGGFSLDEDAGVIIREVHYLEDELCRKTQFGEHPAHLGCGLCWVVADFLLILVANG